MKIVEKLNVNFLLLLFSMEKRTFHQKTFWKNLVFTISFILQFYCTADYLKVSNEILTPIQTCIGLVETHVLLPKILCHRLGILTDQIFQRCTLKKKDESMCQEKCFAQPVHVNKYTSSGIILQCIYISKTCTKFSNKLEKVCLYQK